MKKILLDRMRDEFVHARSDFSYSITTYCSTE